MTSNSLKLQTIPKARLTYVAIGASDTYGTGTHDPVTQSWPADLARRLGPGVHLVNLGIPGIDAHDAANIELPVALDAHPDLITIWLAVNDLNDRVPLTRYRQSLDQILQRLNTLTPHARILVGNVPDLTYLPRFQSVDTQLLRAKIELYNAAIVDVVKRNHVQLVDLYTQWQTLGDHPEYISEDGFHPNSTGYQQIAGAFYQAYRL